MLKALVLAGFVGCFGAHGGSTNGPAGREDLHLPAANDWPRPPEAGWRDLSHWSFQAGVGFITESTVDDVALLGSKLARGDAGGQIYLVQVSYKLAEVKPRLLLHRVRLDVELPL